MYYLRWIKRFFIILMASNFFQNAFAEPLLEEVDDNTVEQIEDQQRGEYAELERPESVPLGQIQDEWDTASPKAGIYTTTYLHDHVIRLKTRPFMTTTIVLPEWEEINDISIGDDDLFLVEKKGDNIVALMSKSEGCDTSLTIIGKSRNIYAFYIRSEGIHSAHIPDIVVYVQSTFLRHKLKHPKKLSKTLAKNDLKDAPDDYMEVVPFLPENVTFLFEMSALDGESRSIAPESVYSDGIWTWLDFKTRWNIITLPAVYLAVDGVDTPVNTRVVGTKIIVHGTGPLTLKSGQKVVCITPLKE